MIFYDLAFDYDKNTASRLLQKNNDIISAEEIRNIYTQIRHVDRATVELANSLASEAGYFLSVHEIEALVKADISASDAAEIVAERRAYVSRLASLIIPIVSFFAIGEDRVVWLATSIDESAHAYWQVVRRERKDRKRRQLVHQMKRISALCQEMLGHVQNIPPSISEEFYEFQEAFSKSAYKSENAGGGIGISNSFESGYRNQAERRALRDRKHVTQAEGGRRSSCWVARSPTSAADPISRLNPHLRGLHA